MMVSPIALTQSFKTKICNSELVDGVRERYHKEA
jgi:hypothetical protein